MPRYSAGVVPGLRRGTAAPERRRRPAPHRAGCHRGVGAAHPYPRPVGAVQWRLSTVGIRYEIFNVISTYCRSSERDFNGGYCTTMGRRTRVVFSAPCLSQPASPSVNPCISPLWSVRDSEIHRRWFVGLTGFCVSLAPLRSFSELGGSKTFTVVFCLTYLQVSPPTKSAQAARSSY